MLFSQTRLSRVIVSLHSIFTLLLSSSSSLFLSVSIFYVANCVCVFICEQCACVHDEITAAAAVVDHRPHDGADDVVDVAEYVHFIRQSSQGASLHYSHNVRSTIYSTGPADVMPAAACWLPPLDRSLTVVVVVVVVTWSPIIPLPAHIRTHTHTNTPTDPRHRGAQQR